MSEEREACGEMARERRCGLQRIPSKTGQERWGYFNGLSVMGRDRKDQQVLSFCICNQIPRRDLHHQRVAFFLVFIIQFNSMHPLFLHPIAHPFLLFHSLFFSPLSLPPLLSLTSPPLSSQAECNVCQVQVYFSTIDFLLPVPLTLQFSVRSESSEVEESSHRVKWKSEVKVKLRVSKRANSNSILALTVKVSELVTREEAMSLINCRQ